MEALKQYLMERIIFDEHDDKSGDNFKTTLFDELERLGIYACDNRAFFDIDPETVIHLAVMECFNIDFTTTIDDISREAMQNLAFNYMYSDLYAEYMKMCEA
jgi:hypothetical protein